MTAGIGFLCARAIIKFNHEQATKGLAAGMGREATAAPSTLLALFLLAALRKIVGVEQQKEEKK